MLTIGQIARNVASLTPSERDGCYTALAIIHLHPGEPESRLLVWGASADSIAWLHTLDLIEHDKGGWWRTGWLTREQSLALFTDLPWNP